MLQISKSAKISKLADVENSIRGSLMSIGDGTYINSGCVLHLGNGIHIGNHVLIAATCTFAPVNHAYKSKYIPICQQVFETSRGGIKIGDDVWIGANIIILDRSVIGTETVMGAQSLVQGGIPPYSICFGTPAKVRGYRY